MKGLKEIKRRLRAVQNTAKITRAMQLVASSKMRFSQRAALGGRRHRQRLEELALRLLPLNKGISLPLLKEREIRRRGIVVVATDKGLCGALNQNTFHLLPLDEENCRYVAIGRKGSQFLAARKKDLLAEFSLNDRVPFFQVRTIGNFLRDSYLNEEIDSVEVFYPLHVNTLRQEATWRKLLPLSDGNLRENLQRQLQLLPTAADKLPEDIRELWVEPNRLLILGALLESFFQQDLFHLLLESKAAEQCARMVAMKTATDNADALAKDLRLEYNKARQAAITNEILELTVVQ